MSELNRLKVVDFTMGRSDSDEVNTNLPFTDNFDKTRTIQQANVVLGAYVNRNYNEMQNKADKDEIPTKVSELENDAGYITDGDIPSKTSDLTNDGADGEHPFIPKEVDNLTNYTDTETLNTDLGLINGDISDINTNLNGINDAIDLQLPNRIGNIVVDSIRSKNMFDGLLEIGAYSFADGTKSASTLYARCVNKIPVIAGKTYRLSYTTSQTISDYGFVFFNNNTYVGSIQGNLTVTIPSNVNYVVFNLGTYPSDFDLSVISKVQFELGSTVTPYRAYQDLNPDITGLDNGHMDGNNGWGGLYKKSIRGNQTTYIFEVPNKQTGGFLRSALAICGDRGLMLIQWSGSNNINPVIRWASFTTTGISILHNNGFLTITFPSIVYGSVDLLFTN